MPQGKTHFPGHYLIVTFNGSSCFDQQDLHKVARVNSGCYNFLKSSTLRREENAKKRVIHCFGPDGSVLPAEAVKEAPAGTAISAVPAKAIALSGVVPMVLAGLFALATSLLLRLKRVHWLKAAPLISVLLLMVTLGLEASPVGLEVGAPLPQEATSGDVLHYVFKIMNTSDVEDTLMLGAASQHGWMTAIPEGSTVRLGPGETAEITVELAVPRAVTAGTEVP